MFNLKQIFMHLLIAMTCLKAEIPVTDSSLADVPLKLICLCIIYLSGLLDADTTLTYKWRCWKRVFLVCRSLFTKQPTVLQFYSCTVLQFNSSTVLQFYSSTVQQFYSSTVLQFYSSTVLQFYSCTVLQFYSSTVLQFYSSTVLQFYSCTVLQFYSSTVLQFYSSTVLQLYSSTVLQFYSSTVLQLYSSTVLQFYSSTVLQFYSSTVQQFCSLHSLGPFINPNKMFCSCTSGFKNQRCDELANPCDYFCQNEGMCTLTALNKPRCK